MPIAPRAGICHHHERIQSFCIVIPFTLITLSTNVAPLFFWNTS
jgi:hypothetical protein